MKKKGTIPTSIKSRTAESVHLRMSGVTICALNAGFFVSRGEGIHPTRIINSDELIFVTKGVLGIREGNTHFEVAAGQSLILLAGREHAGTAVYPPDLQFYWIHFRCGVRKSESQKSIAIPQHAAVRRPERLVELLRWFLDDQESGRLQADQAALLVMHMLHEVADQRPVGSAAERASDLLASRAEEFISVHFAGPVSTAGIARELKCNPDYLGRAFMKVYRRTLTDSIHRCRIRWARKLLLERHANIDEVALKCGYEDTGYFRRIFRRMEGMTPGAFRRLYCRMYVNTE